MAGDLSVTYLAASSTALDNPHDLKLSPDGRYLYVADVGNNRVAILDPETLELLGEFGAGHQSGTHDIESMNRLQQDGGPGGSGSSAESSA